MYFIGKSEFCAFQANFRSQHYNVVGTGPYEMAVPASASIEE